MFQTKRTYGNPAANGNVNRGFAMPGAGAQRNDLGGVSIPVAAMSQTPNVSNRPVKGKRTFFAPQSGSRGFPSPEGPEQARTAGTWDPNGVSPDGLPHFVHTPYYSRGTAAFVPNYGKVLTNPIGAGVVALHRTQASYGPAAQFVNGAIWWTSQSIPTSVNLQGLTSVDQLAAALGPINVQAAMRVG